MVLSFPDKLVWGTHASFDQLLLPIGTRWVVAHDFVQRMNRK